MVLLKDLTDQDPFMFIMIVMTITEITDIMIDMIETTDMTDMMITIGIMTMTDPEEDNYFLNKKESIITMMLSFLLF
jgi:hypothetical protein